MNGFKVFTFLFVTFFHAHFQFHLVNFSFSYQYVQKKTEKLQLLIHIFRRKYIFKTIQLHDEHASKKK